MDIDVKIRKLESRYRAASNAADAAKATHHALSAEPDVNATALEEAKQRWVTLDAKKRAIADEISELEALEEAGGY